MRRNGKAARVAQGLGMAAIALTLNTGLLTVGAAEAADGVTGEEWPGWSTYEFGSMHSDPFMPCTTH